MLQILSVNSLYQVVDNYRINAMYITIADTYI